MANLEGRAATPAGTLERVHELAKVFVKEDGTPNQRAIARETGIARSTVNSMLGKQPPMIEYPRFVIDGDEQEPIEDILARKARHFERKAKAHSDRKWFQIKVKEQKPYGVIMFGDPHLDDDGCNIPLLQSHLEIARKPGVYGLNIGDTTNNWVGRLMRLYANQEASEATAKRLAEWFMFDAGVTWLCWILGNHDDWNGGADRRRSRRPRHKPSNLSSSDCGTGKSCRPRSNTLISLDSRGCTHASCFARAPSLRRGTHNCSSAHASSSSHMRDAGYRTRIGSSTDASRQMT